MKNVLYITCALMLAAFLASCSPIEKRDAAEAAITSADQISATATQSVVNGIKTNKIFVHCTSGAPVQWTDSINIICSSDTAVTLLAKGSQTIVLTALSSDGKLIHKNYTFQVDSLYYRVDPQYGYLTGGSTKIWTWADGSCFGNGGDSETNGPAWWTFTSSVISSTAKEQKLPKEGQGASMVFTLKQKKFAKIDSAGVVLSNGKYSFDMTPDSKNWSKGTLTFTGSNALFCYDPENSYAAFSSTYQIISMDDNKMILHQMGKSNHWYWVFKPLTAVK